MTENNLKELSLEKLLKRKRSLLVILLIHLLTCLALMGMAVASIINYDPEFSMPSWAALLIFLIWIPMMAYNRVYQEISRRRF